MFAPDEDPKDYIMAEKIIGELGGAKRGSYGNADKFVKWVAHNGLDRPAFTNIGRWRYREEASYNKPVYIPWITIDIDNYDILEARQSVEDILGNLWAEGYALRRIYVSYSGKKGFHIQVSTKQVGEPVFTDSDAARTFLETFISDVAAEAEWDPSVLSPQALIRVSGSQHEDTGKYKRTWYADNFLQLTPECIFENISNPKIFTFEDENDEIEQDAREHFTKTASAAKQLLSEARMTEGQERGNGIIRTIKPGLLEGQVFGDKPFHIGRENGAYILGCWYLERYSERMARAKLQDWNKRNEPPLPRSRLQSQLRGAKKTIYGTRRR